MEKSCVTDEWLLDQAVMIGFLFVAVLYVQPPLIPVMAANAKQRLVEPAVHVLHDY
jgi:hypothetical protein